MSDVPEMVARVKTAINKALNIYGASDDTARAVIEAMREPTEAMIKAGIGAQWSCESAEFRTASIWDAMIDEALVPRKASV